MLHRSHLQSAAFSDICSLLKREGVIINSGPKLRSLLTFSPPAARSLRTEYSALECTIEVVDDVAEAISHINTYGSSHTESIVAEDGAYLSSKYSPHTPCAAHIHSLSLSSPLWGTGKDDTFGSCLPAPLFLLLSPTNHTNESSFFLCFVYYVNLPTPRVPTGNSRLIFLINR